MVKTIPALIRLERLQFEKNRWLSGDQGLSSHGKAGPDFLPVGDEEAER